MTLPPGRGTSSARSMSDRSRRWKELRMPRLFGNRCGP